MLPVRHAHGIGCTPNMLRDTWVTSEPLRITITPVCPGSRGCFQNDRRRSHRQGRGWAVIILAYAAQLFFHATATAASYADVQFSGLEALYNSTNGQGWTVSTGWRDSSIGVCSWYGVTCNGDASDKNVTGLSLPDNGLVGDISGAEELVNVTSLEEVDLSGNRLYGSVPRVFGLMPRLETLDLSGNELSSFPAAWGSGASALRHLFLQHNSISGSFPEAWLDANDSSAYPVVHLQSTSSWFPELRSLMLGANDMSSTGYSALQTVVRWRSLQILDLSDNALTGSVEDALTLYVCEGLGSAECGANTSSVGAPSLRVLKLDGNALTGQLPQVADSGGRRIDVLDISNNSGITGSIPVSYSKLLMLFASDTGLSGSEIPFLGDDSTAGVWTHEEKDGLFVCPALEPSAGEDVVALSLDPSYDGYLTCVCDDGYNSSSGGCSECPLGTYRLAEEEEEERDDGLGGSCQACPSNSTTLQKGRWLRSQCVCSPNFYDGLAGGGSEPSCLACPSGSATASAGATNVTSCECGPGYTLNVTSSTCEACPAGTYKPAAGNHIELCLSCPPGSYSEAVGATSSSACEPCPLGSYGESYGADSSASCVECAAGTYGSVEGLNSQLLCTPCWAGHYSPTVGATSVSACIECPANFSQPNTGASASSDCLPCSGGEVADQGSAECVTELLEDGTLIGLYLLIAGIVLVVFTLAWVVLKKHYGVRIPVSQKVHMTLNDEMKAFIFGQQFWISLFSGVEIMDLMSDLGAYASLLYTAALTGAMKIVYTIVVAFALVASLHGVHTRAILILDMQEERRHGLAITGNNMLYYEKQFNILQIMTQKRTCRRHVPFDRGNKYLSHHISVQRLISLNSMRIIIAVFEDVPFLGLNMFLLLRQPHLAKNLVFMMSFVMSIFVLGYKMTLLEKHARLQIRKWNLEARMDTDTMLNKKAARGRRFSWACQQCKAEGISPEAQRESTRMLSAQIDGFAGTKRGSSSISREDERRASGGKRDSRSAGSDSSVSAGLNVNTTGGAKSVPAKVGEKTSAAAGKGNKQQHLPRGEGDDDDGGGGGGGRDGGGGGTATPAAAAAPTATETDAKSKSCFSFGGGAKKSATTGGKRNDSEGRGGRRRQQNKVLPSEAADPDNDDGAADALMPPDHQMSSYLLGAESARGFGGGSATEAGRRRSAADR